MPIGEATLDAIRARYDAGSELLADLQTANEIRTATVREERIEELDGLLQSMAALGLFDDAVSLPADDEAAILAFDAELEELLFEVRSVNDMASIELQLAHAQWLQKVLAHEYFGWVRLAWMRYSTANRGRDVPQEVYDLFTVDVVNRMHIFAGWQAGKCKRIVELGCAVDQDFQPIAMGFGALNAVDASAKDAVTTYKAYEAQQQELERLSRELDTSPSIASQLWSVIGWDDPLDFLSDVVLTAATGGAGKVAKWGRKVYRVKQRISKAKKLSKRLQALKDQLDRIEKGYEKVFAAAGRIRKLKRPQRIAEAIARNVERLKEREKQLEVLNEVRNALLVNFGRDAVSTIASNLANGHFKGVGSDLSKVTAKQAIDHYLNAKPPFTDIARIRRSANFKSVLLDPNDDGHADIFWRYFSLLLAREFIARAMIAIGRKRELTADLLLDAFLESLASAIESIIIDHPLVPSALAHPAARTVIATGRKILVNFGKDLVDELRKLGG